MTRNLLDDKDALEEEAKSILNLIASIVRLHLGHNWVRLKCILNAFQICSPQKTFTAVRSRIELFFYHN